MGKANIVPVCLAAVSTPLGDKKFKLLGWGVRYEETPRYAGRFTKRNPILSSCMTNQAGPLQWRFQNCDMKRLKRPGKNGKYVWKCDTVNPPPDYKSSKGRSKRCREYFNVANNIKDKLNSNKPLAETWLKDIDFIYVYDKNGDKEQCYNQKLLTTRGWCYLKDYKEKGKKKSSGKKQLEVHAWGFCSSSCKDMEVNYLAYYCIYLTLPISLVKPYIINSNQLRIYIIIGSSQRARHIAIFGIVL